MSAEARGLAVLDLSVREFVGQLASKSAVPGGGSASALVGALAAGLVSMVCQLTVGREQFAAVATAVDTVMQRADVLRAALLDLVEADAAAYADYAAARRQPRGTPEERRLRSEAAQTAIRRATEVPLRLVELCADLLDIARQAASIGNPSVISDAAVGALLADAARHSGELNVVLNLRHLHDQRFAARVQQQLSLALGRSEGIADAVLAEVRRRLVQ